MSITPTIATKAADASNSTQSDSASSSARTPTQTLGQADFLKLLVAQLSAQDPLNPISNTDFIAQMAQFSTLQATTAMQASMSSVQSGMNLMQAYTLLGKTVNVLTSSGETATGPVSAIQYQSGAPCVVVNGQTYSLSQITSVSQTNTQTQTQSN